MIARIGSAAALLLSICACATNPTPSTYGPAALLGVAQGTAEPQSLFPSDVEVLSDSAIRRILAYRLVLPAKSRVAVLQLNSPWTYRRWWSQSASRIGADATNVFLKALAQSERVAAANTLPLLLTPQKQTVPFLREAAARFQADLLLVYQPSCALLERSRFLAGSEYRAACTVEAILLDVRSGIVPLSVATSGEYTGRRTDTDFNQQDFMLRIELQAVAAALDSLARDVGAFLQTVPLVGQAGP